MSHDPALTSLQLSLAGDHTDRLELWFKPISTPAQRALLTAILQRLPQLVSIVIVAADLQDAGVLTVAAALPSLHRLHTLRLPANGIAGTSCDALAAALLAVPQLRRLSLNENALGADAGMALASALHSLPELTSVALRECDLGEQGTVAVAHALVHAHALAWLDLADNQCGTHAADALAHLLAAQPHLDALWLQGNALRAAGAVHLAHGLATHSTYPLSRLNLSDNALGDDGLDALVPHLARMGNLRELALTDNALGAASAAALATVLGGMAKLTHLQLSGNALGDRGVRSLARALHQVPRLHLLGLRDCALGVDGACALSAHLRPLTGAQLNSLFVDDNDITAQGAQALALQLTLSATLDIFVNDDLAAHVDEPPSDAQDAELALRQLEARFSGHLLLPVLLGVHYAQPQDADTSSIGRLVAHPLFDVNVLALVSSCLTGSSPSCFLSFTQSRTRT